MPHRATKPVSLSLSLAMWLSVTVSLYISMSLLVSLSLFLYLSRKTPSATRRFEHIARLLPKVKPFIYQLDR